MAFDFPSSPVPGQIFEPVGGLRYRYDPPVWNVITGANPLPVAPINGMIWAPDFGVSIGKTEDQSLKLQAAIDYAEFAKCELRLPAGYVRLDNTIFVGRTNPVRIIGQQAHRVYGFTDNQEDDVTLLWCENMPVGTIAISVFAVDLSPVPVNTRDGVTISNMAIVRTTTATPGDGRVGVKFNGTTSPLMENVLIHGFDVNLWLSQTIDGARGTFYGQFRNVVSMVAGNHCGLVTYASDCDFYHCHFGGCTVAGFHIVAPNNSNGNRWFGCVFTASQGTIPQHALLVEAGFWQSFHACDFEGSADANVKIDIGTTLDASSFNVAMTDCWFSAAVVNSKGCLWLANGNLMFQGGRMANVSSSTEALIRIKPVVHSGTGFTIIDNLIATYRNIGGVDVNNYSTLKITNSQFIASGSGVGLPAIMLGNDVDRSIVTDCTFTTSHNPGYTNASASGGNRFTNNIMSNSLPAADDYQYLAVGGPVQTVLSTTARHQLLGNGQAITTKLVGKYSVDNAGAHAIFYKSRGATVGGRGAVASGDQVFLRRFAADDGTNDIEVVREQVLVDGVTGGSWEIWTRTASPASFIRRMQIDGAGSVTFRSTSLLATATDGFVYLPGGNGAPTGVPVAKPGQVPVYIDSTNNKFYFYSSGAWRDAGP